jgi:hypothetical protein
LLWAAAALVGCERAGQHAAPAASESPSAPSLPAPVSSRPTPRPELGCRAIRVEGQVRRQGGAAVDTGDLLDGVSWVELGESARLGLRHSRSGRELLVSGPALVLPCSAGEEQLLLATGQVETSYGAGARPGAQVLIATPFAVVRSAEATLLIRASGRQLAIDCSAGEARIDLAAGAKLRGRELLRPKSRATIRSAPEIPALMDACEKEAERAETLGRQVLSSGDAGATLGERAARHVEARQKARSACAILAAAAATRPEPERAATLARAASADRRWRAVPAASPGRR